MKSKVDKEIEESEEEIEEASQEPEDAEIEYDYGDNDDAVEAGGPDVASGKGSKITLIAFSAILIGVVLYILFFGGDKAPKDDGKLELVDNTSDFSSETPAAPTDSREFDSIFEDATPGTDTREDVILDTPDIPSVPKLPNIFGDDAGEDVLPAFLDLPGTRGSRGSRSGPGGALIGSDGQLADPRRAIGDLLLPPGVNLDGTTIPFNPTGGGQNPDGTAIPPGTIGGVPGTPGVPGSAVPGDQGGGVDTQTNTTTPASIIVVAGAPGPTNSVGYENNIINLNKNPIDELEVTAPQISSQYIKDRGTTLVQGKIINAVLETAVNTEFPGEVRGIISRDVYAESGSNILIPRGSRIYGAYASTVQRGQARVTINWTRLIRPDGVDASVSLNAADQFGRAGIEGDVDNKYGSIISNSILTSVLAVGGAIAAEKLSGNTSTTTTTDPTTGTSTSTGSASGQAIADVSKTIIDTVGEVVGNTIDLSPVIRVPQGTKITIVVNSDMSLPEFKK